MTPKQSDKSGKLLKSTSFKSDNTNNSPLASSIKSSKILKTSEPSASVIYNNKTESRSSKTKSFNTLKSDEKSNKEKFKAVDDFINSFFEEPKKITKGVSENIILEKKKDMERFKNKDKKKLDKEEKLTEKDQMKKAITIKKLESNKNCESSRPNSSGSNKEFTDNRKKPKNLIDEIVKQKSKKNFSLNNVVKENKPKLIETKITNRIDNNKSKILTIENKSEVIFNF